MLHLPLRLVAAGAVMLSVSTTALADRAAADACAAGLTPPSKLIYTATIGSVGSGQLKDVVRSKTRDLVMAGKVSRGEAQTAAEAAGACLTKAR